MLILDAHVHIWESGNPRGAHRQAPYSAEEILIDMDRAGVNAGIIQPPAWDMNANAIAIAAATKYRKRFGILGNFSLDLKNKEEVLKNWKSQTGMLGLRYILNDPKHLHQIQDGELDWLWAGAQEKSIPIAIACSSHLMVLDKVAKCFPKLRLIIDHLGVPLDARDELAFIQIPQLCELAKNPNIAIKATAVPAYSSEAYPYFNIENSVKTIFDAFGAHRFFWGSDITKLNCTWSQCIELFTKHYEWIKPFELEQVMGIALRDWLDWNY